MLAMSMKSKSGGQSKAAQKSFADLRKRIEAFD
jgi:hypothetical protein